MKKGLAVKIAGLAAFGASLFSGGAMASDCATVLSQYNHYDQECKTGLFPSACSYAADLRSSHPECFSGASSCATKDNMAATSSSIINATSFSQAMTISNAISSRFMGFGRAPQKMAMLEEGKGMAAGGAPNPWNVWANVDKNDTTYKYRTDSNVGTKGKADVLNSVFGVDYLLSPQFVLGVSAAIDDGDGHRKFDDNGVLEKSKLDSRGWMVSPYFAWQINPMFALDFAAGMGKGKVSWKNSATQVKDKADADRVFAALNLSYTNYVGNWQLLGKMSYLYGAEDFGSIKQNGVRLADTKTKNTLDQIRLGMQAGYMMAGGFMPYAGLSYSNNVRRTSDTGKDYLGRDTFIATVGMNFFSASNKVSGGIFYSQELDRKHSDNDIISANINFRF